jgi:hypothetical protein
LERTRYWGEGSGRKRKGRREGLSQESREMGRGERIQGGKGKEKPGRRGKRKRRHYYYYYYLFIE